jgi:hypothetical protein
MTKSCKRRSSHLQNSSWGTFNPSGQELDGTKKIRVKKKYPAREVRFFRKSQKKVTLPPIDLPDYSDE